MSSPHSKIPFRTVLACCLAFGLSSLARAAGPTVAVERVKPNKVLYAYNESATADITLHNMTDQNQDGQLTVSDEWDLVESRAISRQPITLKSGETKIFPIHWEVGREMYGHGLRATFAQEGRDSSHAIEFYQVADPHKWMRCFMINAGGDNEEAQMKANPFTTYINLDHHFAYMPSGFSLLAPEQDRWVGGQFNINFDRKEILENIRVRRAMGPRPGAYTIGATAGPTGYELAREHPEWFLRDKRGAFHLADTTVSPVEVAGTITQPLSSWYALVPDFGNPEIVRHAGEEIVRAIKMFGWDAVFFDGIYGVLAYNPPTYTWDGKLRNNEERSQLSTDCVKTVRQIIRTAYPDVGLWYNGSAPRPGDPLRDAQIESLRDTNCATLMEIQGAQIADPNFVGHYWRNLYEMAVGQQKALQSVPGLTDTPLACGYLYNTSAQRMMTKEEFAKTRDTWTTANHIGALFLATRIHPCVMNSTGFRPATQFMTRYSALLWAEGLEPVKEPWKQINVESNREVWWEECVSTRKRPDYRDTLIGVMNSPDNEQIDFKASQDPTAAKSVELEFTTDTDPTRVTFWALQPYGYGSAERAPTLVELKPEVDGKKLIVELPSFTYYSLVVIRERGR